MSKKVNPLEKKITSRPDRTRSRDSLSFKDKTATQTPDSTRGNSSLEASDLFSFFTANIIREEKVFTR